MNIQVGAGGVRLEGFLNVDIRKVEGVDIVGDAADLRTIESGTVDVLFGNALFEHLYLGHQLAALREWKRVLGPEGVLIVLGLPDFEMIARFYLQRAPGIVGERFDLLNVYRYTHGEPEHATPPVWPVWHAAGDGAPGGWLPQLHKCLFDAAYVSGLLEETGFRAALFDYAYPGEEHALNLGFIAAAGAGAALPGTVGEIRKGLARIPGVEKFANLESITPRGDSVVHEGLLKVARNLDSTRPKPLWKKITNRVAKLIPAAASI